MASLVQLGCEHNLEGSEATGSPSLPLQHLYYPRHVGYLGWEAVLFDLALGHWGVGVLEILAEGERGTKVHGKSPFSPVHSAVSAAAEWSLQTEFP